MHSWRVELKLESGRLDGGEDKIGPFYFITSNIVFSFTARFVVGSNVQY